MQYHRLLSGGRFLGKCFTFEARHLFMSQIGHEAQRNVLWEAVTAYDQQPTEEQIVEVEDIEIEFGLKSATFH